MNLRQLNYKQNVITNRPFNIEWKMKDGTIVTSHNMGNSHISNCINLLVKRIIKIKHLSYDKEAITYSIAEMNLTIKLFKEELKWRDKNNVIIHNTKK